MSDLDRLFESFSLPNSVTVEAYLLASLFANNNGVDQVSDIVEPHHFYSELHGEIYAEILRLTSIGKQAIPPAMVGKFDAEDLADVAGHLVSTLNNREYAKTIKAAFDRRQIIEIAERMRKGALTQSVGDSVDDIREQAEAELFALTSTESSSSAVTIGDAAAETIKQIKERMDAVASGGMTGVSSSITQLDKMLGGFQPSDLIILAGRPSMGKTALSLEFSYAGAHETTIGVDDKDGAVLYVSLEMTSSQLCERIFSNKANVSYSDIVGGRIDQNTFYCLNEFAQELASSKMVIDDKENATVARIRSQARRISRKVGLKMIVVDYLGFLKTPSDVTGNENNKVGYNTGALKALAKEMNVPVILLSQLSRAVENREDKRPQLSDLRDSGSIEQDADVVLFVYRQEYYLEREEPLQRSGESVDKFGERYAKWQEQLNQCRGTADIIVAKARRGRVGTVRCSFNGDRQRFANLYE